MLHSPSPYSQQFSLTHSGGFLGKSMGSFGKPLNSNQQANPQRQGQFISKDKRKEISKSIREAHFKFGFDKSTLETASPSKDKFKESDNVNSAKSQKERGELNEYIQLNRKSNIALGNKTFYNQTVNNTFFNHPLRQLSQSPTKGLSPLLQFEGITSDYLKADLRKEHFKLGSDKINLVTTNMDLAMTNKEEDFDFRNDEKKKNQKLKQDMRGHHFTYGATPILYNTTAKMQFKQYDLKDLSKQNDKGRENSLRMKTQGNILLQDPQLHHRFRYNSVTINKDEHLPNQQQLTAHDRQILNQKQLTMAYELKQDLKRSHIDLGKSSENNFVSSFQQNFGLGNGGAHSQSHTTFLTMKNQQQIDSLSKTSRVEFQFRNNQNDLKQAASDIDTMKKDLHATHITIGSRDHLFNPSSRDDFKQNLLCRDITDDKKNNDKLASFLKKEKFQLGEQSNVQKSYQNFYSSVYKCASDKDLVKQGKPAIKADCDAQIGSITLGFFQDKEKQGMMTETRSKFMFQHVENDEKSQRQSDIEKFSQRIKQHNFELSYNKFPNENHYQTIQNKTNQETFLKTQELLSSQDKNKNSQLKEYLQQSHLKIGSLTGDSGSNSQKQSYLEQINSNKPRHQPAKKPNFGNNFKLGTTKADFMTNNKDYYTWIQPKILL